MKDALLVLLGALISCGTTLFLDWLKFGREDGVYYRKKREETYLEMLEILENVFWVKTFEHIHCTPDIDLKETTDKLNAKAQLYVKKQIADDYHKLITDLYRNNNGEKGFTFSKWEKLVSDIRKDLNIKDK